MQVPYVDLARQHAPLKTELMDAIGKVLDHGQFVLGNEVQLFEQRFAELCGAHFAVGVNSGTDALILALQVLGIGLGDEVITVPNSFVATASAIRIVGAMPVFVDVDEEYNMDPDRLEEAITPKTKAVLPVHLTGRAAKMDAIGRIVAHHGLRLVEDCAQAILARHRGQSVGTFGAVGCFSLHPLKNLNACGDGGVLTTNDPGVYEALKIRRNLGLKTREDCVLWSENTRLDTIQAAILLVKLNYLEQWTQRRRDNARYYRKNLAGLKEISVPGEHEWEYAVYHTFVVQAEQRDDLRTFLASRGIGTAVHYPLPIHLTSAGRGLGYAGGSFPVAESQAKRIVSLPVYPELTTNDLDYIIQNLFDFYAH
ncbi:MAG: DegT/DnrJ/EryC1/StrS family aminotransferase [Terracidiphilus sp.]